MTVCAVVNKYTNIVINKIVAEPTDLPPDDCFLVDITDTDVDINWIWDGTWFVPPITDPTESESS